MPLPRCIYILIEIYSVHRGDIDFWTLFGASLLEYLILSIWSFLPEKNVRISLRYGVVVFAGIACMIAGFHVASIRLELFMVSEETRLLDPSIDDIHRAIHAFFLSYVCSSRRLCLPTSRRKAAMTG